MKIKVNNKYLWYNKFLNAYVNAESPELGDLWYQPSIMSDLFPDTRGRLLKYAVGENDELTWCDVPINSIEHNIKTDTLKLD